MIEHDKSIRISKNKDKKKNSVEKSKDKDKKKDSDVKVKLTDKSVNDEVSIQTKKINKMIILLWMMRMTNNHNGVKFLIR